ncbi:MAG: uracil-DNA glycosylase [Geminicoccaceae bacterium]
MSGKRKDTVTAADPTLLAWLDWYREMGITDLVAEKPIDRFGRPEPLSERPREPELGAVKLVEDGPGQPAPATSITRKQSEDGPPSWVLDPEDETVPISAARRSERRPQTMPGLGGSAEDARALALSCDSLEALAAALASFDGCPLKETAINLGFADGNPKASIMLIGEAPGAHEDRQGKPFVGPSGQLLDRMLATIGLDRTKVYITNVIYWRPPGNRTPTAAEIAICQPFLERQIELLRPKLLVFVGGIAARALLGVTQGVTKVRGRPFTYTAADCNEMPAIVMFHPAYLLRQPAQKRFSWRDLLVIQEKIKKS